jgi:2-polyprenyl-6-methoxyphenol hydroxylase-like FAD-dependent oxidoreductase
MPNRRVLIVGGSMSGLFAGLLLRRAGFDVDIFERAEDELAGRGAGIVAQPDLLATLRRLGLEARDLGVEVTIRQILDRSGKVIGERECPQVMTSWERVFRILRDAFPSDRYHRGKGLSVFEQSGDGVTARFADGDSASADILVGCDGLRSTVRQQCLPDLAALYAGYVAWRALIPEDALSHRTHADIFGAMAFCLPPGEQILGYPVAGHDNDLRPGHRRYNMVWYRPADESSELISLLTDTQGETHAISIPPPLIRHEPIDAMRKAAERLLAPQFIEIVRLAAQPILQPIYDLETPSMAFGRVAIIGDAAFVARPHVGAGISKAADDALALSDALQQHGDVEAALRDFEQNRLATGRKIIERARHLGAYLQAEHRTAEERARSQRHSIPQAVLAETALLDFLQT